PQRIKYRTNDTPSRASGSGRVRYLLGASALQTVIVAALTLPFFFLIPRLGGGGVARGFGEGDTFTGFSERVELGQGASIKRSPRVVMRVRLNRKTPRYLRWRGVALDNYDGRSWSVTKKEILMRQPGNSTSDAAATSLPFSYRYGLSTPTSHLALLEQRFVLEPLDTPALFAAQKAFSIQGPMSSIVVDDHTVAITAVGLKGRTVYGVSSDISIPSEPELRADSPASSPDEIRKYYLPS